MKLKILIVAISALPVLINAQKLTFSTLLNDKISIRAIEEDGGKIWYAGSNSKFGYVSVKDSADKKQLLLSEKPLEFRTLAHDRTGFYTINIESPAQFFKIGKKNLQSEIVYRDTLKTAFYDALHFVDAGLAYALSDPDKSQNLRLAVINKKGKNKWYTIDFQGKIKFNNGEAAFAASNSNIASSKNYLWIATGGTASRIIRLDLKKENFEIFDTPFVQGTSSQGMYSIDFYKDKFGIAVGGDNTKKSDNINNIATTYDGGKTWQIQASGKNGGYKTCVKIRPGSKGREIISVGDQNIEYSKDFGRTWTTISTEKNLYTCVWLDRNNLVFAGKDRILKGKLTF